MGDPYIRNLLTLRTKTFARKVSAEKVSDKFFNFSGKNFGQCFLGRKTFGQGFYYIIYAILDKN